MDRAHPTGRTFHERLSQLAGRPVAARRPGLSTRERQARGLRAAEQPERDLEGEHVVSDVDDGCGVEEATAGRRGGVGVCEEYGEDDKGWEDGVGGLDF